MIERTKKFLIFEGLLFLVLGVLAVAWPKVSTLAVEIIFGWLFILGGVTQIFRAFQTRGSSHVFLSLLMGILYSFFGVLLLIFPNRGILSLTLLLILLFFIQGLLQIYHGFTSPEKRIKSWMIFSGIVTLILAFLIWNSWPEDADWVLGVLTGINLIFLGISQLVLSSFLKK